MEEFRPSKSKTQKNKRAAAKTRKTEKEVQEEANRLVLFDEKGREVDPWELQSTENIDLLGQTFNEDQVADCIERGFVYSQVVRSGDIVQKVEGREYVEFKIGNKYKDVLVLSRTLVSE